MCESIKKYTIPEMRTEGYWYNYWIEEKKAFKCQKESCESCKQILMRRDDNLKNCYKKQRLNKIIDYSIYMEPKDFTLDSIEELEELYNKNLGDFMVITRNIINKSYIRQPKSLEKLYEILKNATETLERYKKQHKQKFFISNNFEHHKNTIKNIKDQIERTERKNTYYKKVVRLFDKKIPSDVFNIIDSFLIL